METEVIAIIGAGKGGTAILETLLKMPSVITKHVCDVNPSAPGIALARQHGIQCHTQMAEICQDKEVDLIFEVTGRKEIFARILAQKPENTRVIGSEDARIIFHLLDLQQEVSERLEDYNLILERRVLERTMELEKANTELEKKIIEYEKLNEKTKYLMHATHQLKAPFTTRPAEQSSQSPLKKNRIHLPEYRSLTTVLALTKNIKAVFSTNISGPIRPLT